MYIVDTGRLGSRAQLVMFLFWGAGDRLALSI